MTNNKLIDLTFLFFLLVTSVQTARLKANIAPIKDENDIVLEQSKTFQTNNTTSTSTNSNNPMVPKLLPGQSYNFENGEKKYFAVGQCTVTNCKSPYGKCTSDQICECNRDFGHDIKKAANANELSCSIPLKQQYIFFFLELFTWIGVGHFYSGRIIYGIIKLVFVTIVIFLDCLIKRLCIKKQGFKTQKAYNLTMWCLYFMVLVFQTFDITMIGLNKFLDGNGFTFRTWDAYY